MFEYAIKNISYIATIFASFAAFYAVVIKKNDLFRGSLYNRQVDELLSIRKKLHDVWYDSYRAQIWASSITKMNKSLKQFQKEQPDEWKDYLKLQSNCFYILYSFSHEENIMLPKHFKPKDHKDLHEAFSKMAPFSLVENFGKTSSEDMNAFKDLIINKIREIDMCLR